MTLPLSISVAHTPRGLKNGDSATRTYERSALGQAGKGQTFLISQSQKRGSQGGGKK